jgi:ATP-binding cassette, subfamily A (ABC1), member 3
MKQTHCVSTPLGRNRYIILVLTFLADNIAIMSNGRCLVEGTSAMLKESHGGGFKVKYHDNTTRAKDLADIRHTLNSLTSGEEVNIDIQCPTIEDVFLKLASNGATNESTESIGSTYDNTMDNNPAEEKAASVGTPGKGTNFLQQTWILFRKRLLILRRNWIPTACAIIVPALVAGLSCYGFINFDPIPCSIDAARSNPQVLTLGALERYWGVEVPVGPRDQFSLSSLPAAYAPFRSRLRLVDDYDAFQAYIHENFRDVAPGGFYLHPNDTTLMSYRINGNPGYAGLAKNLADSFLSGVTINADFSTFALPFTGSTGDSLQLILYITLGLCVYPAFLALYPTYERLSNVRALHYTSSVRPASLWLAYATFDGLVALIMAVVVIAIMTGISNVWYAPAYLFAVIFLYGLCSTLLAYVISLYSKTQLAAFAVSAGYHAVSMLIYFILYLVLLTFGSAEQLQDNLNTVQFSYGLIAPAGSLLRAMLLTLNQSQILCRTTSFVDYPGDIEVYGGPILYLTLQIIALYGFLVCHDSISWMTALDWIKRSRIADDEREGKTISAASVVAETARTKSSQDELRLLDVSKRFGRETAVDNVTFGVDRGQVMALLGPNGAGKTTTISLVRGDLRPSSGSSQLLIAGHDVQGKKLAAQRHLGVCPQFNASDRLTVTEHLEFYARIRGVRNIKERVRAAVEAYGLSEYRRRLVYQLSGGNQRRLSLATAMIGSPTVVLLDEPSTGVDALAMRRLWGLIIKMKSRAAVVITTHSMEEANVLADKATILQTKLLAVGSPADLRNQYAAGVYQLHLVHKAGSNASTEDMEKVVDWLSRASGAQLRRGAKDSLHGQIRCQVVFNDTDATIENERGHNPLLDFLELLEDAKRNLDIAYYSIDRPTLQDVFLDILEAHIR